MWWGAVCQIIMHYCFLPSGKEGGPAAHRGSENPRKQYFNSKISCNFGVGKERKITLFLGLPDTSHCPRPRHAGWVSSPICKTERF